MMEREEREKLEEELLQYPIMQFAYLKTEKISFLQRVREVCKNECPRYGTSWSCPPAVGTVAECRERCSAYPDVIVFSTIAEVNDETNMEETLATRAEHEEITHGVSDIFMRNGKHSVFKNICIIIMAAASSNGEIVLKSFFLVDVITHVPFST